MRKRRRAFGPAALFAIHNTSVPVPPMLYSLMHMHIILRYLGTVAAVTLTLYIVPGISSAGWETILLAALVWSVITMVIRPVLQILTLPITIVTFGIFSFVLNALLFWAMTLIVPGFTVAGFWPALLGAVVLSLLSWLISKVL